MFVTFEGGDGAGKTTLMKRLYDHLKRKKRKVVMTRAPGGTELGMKIRGLVLDHHHVVPRAELLLFLADRAQHVDEEIEPALKQGSIVLCDRFNDSTIAYQGGGRGFPQTLLKTFCDFSSLKREPDLTFFLDLPPTKGFSRIKRGHDRLEKIGRDFHMKVYRAFCRLAKRYPKRIVRLDATKSPEEVFEQALPHLERRLAARSRR